MCASFFYHVTFSSWHDSLRRVILYQQDDPENTAARFSGDFYITGWRVDSH